jgi:uncharacterized protein YbjT (DUF2867 family)
VPKWAATSTQPIAVDDVIRYLVGVCGKEAAMGGTFEIGGPDQLTYIDMLRVAAKEDTGRNVPIIQVPVLSPGLSSRWLSLVTDVDVTTGRNLIDSMGTEVVVKEQRIREIVPGEPMGYAEAVRQALREGGKKQRRHS